VVTVMKRRFLVCHDYGMGGIWAYLLADSEQQILDRFWGLMVHHEIPQWFSEEDIADLESRVYDIDQLDVADPNTRWLLKLRKLQVPGSGTNPRS
jgi:hypothetical protein